MHTKNKGNIGELYAAAFFSEHNFSVFTQLGDNSPIDIIVQSKSKLYRIQCKAVFPKNNVLYLYIVKSGKGYKKAYEVDDVDFFTLYDLENKKLYLINSKEALIRKTAFKLRLNKPKNNQTKGINLAEEYLAEKVLTKYFD